MLQRDAHRADLPRGACGRTLEKRCRSDAVSGEVIGGSSFTIVPETGVGFGLKAAVPSRRDEILNRIIAGIAQGPHQRFGLVEMAHPVITPMHDINGDVSQSGGMVEDIVVIAISRTVAKESAIDHVVDEDPGGS